MFLIEHFGKGVNYFFILCIIMGIIILIIPNILEVVIAIFFIVVGVSGLATKRF
jgi:hypothetical protein